jgi:hypothetical protein
MQRLFTRRRSRKPDWVSLMPCRYAADLQEIARKFAVGRSRLDIHLQYSDSELDLTDLAF